MLVPIKKNLHFQEATKGKFVIVEFKKVPLHSWFRIGKHWFWKKSDQAGEAESGFHLMMFPEICVGLNLRYFTDPNF